MAAELNPKIVEGGRGVRGVVEVRRLLSATGRSPILRSFGLRFLLVDSGESPWEIEGVEEFEDVEGVSVWIDELEDPPHELKMSKVAKMSVCWCRWFSGRVLGARD